jgi:transposase-like protein
MDQKKAFVIEAMGGVNFRELCREYGISAKTGYKWRERLLSGSPRLSAARHPDFAFRQQEAFG